MPASSLDLGYEVDGDTPAPPRTRMAPLRLPALPALLCSIRPDMTLGMMFVLRTCLGLRYFKFEQTASDQALVDGCWLF
jgi:hypothetical protein